MKKFAFITVPSQELERPPAAAAALIACAAEVNWQGKAFDFNLFLNTHVSTDVWVELESYWRCKTYSLSPKARADFDYVCDLFLTEIKNYTPDLIGLSVFTRMSVLCALELLLKIKKYTNCSIVIGGNGAIAAPYNLPSLSIDKTVNVGTFAEYALDTKLIDYYIIGDGEVALMKLLQGVTDYPGINNLQPTQIKDLKSLPQPDYTGIEPEKYFYTHEPGIYITASRGCIRKCSFCNVPDMWPTYTNRSAEDVLTEIIRGKKKFNTNIFHFTDSLINGNMKFWRKLNQLLIDAKQSDPELATVKYLGQFICRTRLDQTESDWENMAKAGADMLVTGFESYSPSVRKHMGKHYSNADIDFHFAQSAKFGIKNIALMFIGYPTETLEDHEYNIEFLHRYQTYAKAGIIHMVRWGYTGMFKQSSKICGSDDVDLVTDPNFIQKFNNLPSGIKGIASGFGWLNKNNPTLTLKERIRRRLELHELSVKLGWPQTRSREELQILYNILSNLTNNCSTLQDFETLETLLDFH
jgi:hypothetical protein